MRNFAQKLKEKKKYLKIVKEKAAIAISTFLILSMLISLFALPNVNAQSWLPIMNPESTKVLPNSTMNIDLNGPSEPYDGITLSVMYPGDTFFTNVSAHTSRSNGDLDVPFTFGPDLGEYGFKWILPPQGEIPANPADPDGNWHSDVVIVTVVAEITRQSYPYIGATPNPVGVGQETLLHIGITQQLSLVQMGWDDLTVTVGKPDDTTETLGPFRTDSTGGTGTIFVPDEEGTYTLQTHFPQQVTTADNQGPTVSAGTTMLAGDSPVLELVVTSEEIQLYPTHPLPTEYWKRPIDAQLRSWAAISESWLSEDVHHFTEGMEDAPETAHILWNHPLEIGGLSGGVLGDAGAYTGDAYEGNFDNSLIIQGILLYRKFDSIGGNNVENWIVAVDLHTGEKLWERELLTPDGARRSLSFGQIYYWSSFNAHGTHSYVFGTSGSTWDAFDPLTGRWLFTMENVPGGTSLRGPHGEIIRYQVDLNSGYVTMWNSSAVIDLYWGDNPNSPNWGSWRPQGKTVDASGPCDVTPATPYGYNGIQMNFSIPTGLPGSAYLYKIGDKIVGSQMVSEQSYFGGTLGVSKIIHWAISLKPGQEGTLLYNKEWNAPSDWLTGSQSTTRAAGSIDDGVICYVTKEFIQWYGFSTDTGDFLWGPTEPPQHYLDHLSMGFGGRSEVTNGKLFSQSMSGILYCYDVENGDLLYTYEADDPYNEVLWANQWHIRMLFSAGGKLYMGTTEHSPVDPLTRGGPFCAIDIETGEEVFRADGLFRQTDWGGRATIGDSVIATMDTYDLQVYGIGKGPSDTDVWIQNDIITHGGSVLVKGMVTDVSPGTEQYALRARFPDGVPAVSDDNMSDWMLYVYKNFARPADVMGVDVMVEVLDPNNNYYEVASTTSDSSGFFSAVFTPEVPGKYTVIASFPGSKAYYGSFAETAVQVEDAPPSDPEPTPQAASVADMYLVPSTIGIIVAIVVVGLILVLMLRKR